MVTLTVMLGGAVLMRWTGTGEDMAAILESLHMQPSWQAVLSPTE